VAHFSRGKLLSFLLNLQPFETMAQSQQTSAAIGLATVATVALICSWGKVDFMSRTLAIEKLAPS